MKKLILGFGTNQTVESLEVFTRSARDVWTAEQADIGLLTNATAGIEPLLAETGTIAISTPNNYRPSTGKYAKIWNRVYLHSLRLLSRSAIGKPPELYEGYLTMLETWHHPQLARWFAYRRVLDLFPNYSHVMLADTKDVVFQDDVFAHVDPQRVNLCEDGEGFSPDSWNSRWYVEAYGQKEYDQIRDRTPICIGTVIGEIGALRRVTHRFTDRIAASPFGKIEQAIFNRMVLLDEFGDDVAICPNYGPVATLAGAEVVAASITMRDDDAICRRDGSLLPVVHMYDRHVICHEPTLRRFSRPAG
ncbi:hypothetical protein FNJ84_13945 [Paracoccus sp. M683]|uniref:hypothetical protein n=1 Tax=Paracoccus sp. M683 TaxID=2594268 RepID=UPI00117DF55A|nr:hypothetical protein [Paracoccus sp. M683]TRW95947.1 hypothetical protein FNJ84_13945 [Paracoccus sp. M683]